MINNDNPATPLTERELRFIKTITELKLLLLEVNRISKYSITYNSGHYCEYQTALQSIRDKTANLIKKLS